MISADAMIGRKVRRVEDPALLTGRGRYLDDIAFTDAAHVAFVRSAHAHARLGAIDVAAAAALPGVDAVFTAETLLPHLRQLRLPIAFPEGQLAATAMQPVLARDEVRYVGEPLAMVVARSRAVAEDAVDAVLVDYDPLPIVVDPRRALDAATSASLDEPRAVFKRFQVQYGDCDAAFRGAPVVLQQNLRQHRGLAHPMEGRGIAARHDRATGELIVWASTQISHGLRENLAEMLELPEDLVRVIASDVGGGFGAKYLVYPEDVAVAAAAMILGGAVKWVEDRREHAIGAIQERDQHWDLEIALEADGRIRGVRGTMIHDQGAYAPHSINVPFNSAVSLPGAYVVPNYALDVVVARTNLPPVIPVRGAGYPQGCFALERLLDRAAAALSLDRAEIRRRNLIRPDQMPYDTPMRTRAGAPISYDSGDYPACQAQGLDLADYAGFAARQAQARATGRYLGIGIAHAVKGTGRGPFESGRVRVLPTGRVAIYTGALAMGQGLKTALAQICAATLSVPLDLIDVVAGDTGFVSLGHGGYASRQTVTAGSSVLVASRIIRDKAIKVGAQLLEAAEADLVLEDGAVRVRGVPEMSVPLGRIAATLRGLPGYSFPDGVSAGLEEEAHFRVDSLAYANAFHVCEVEVDPQTGAVRILRYVAIHDSGTLINPLIAEGQIHGGIAHGIGNALLEHMVYDVNGQPLTTTLAEYLLPTSTDVPVFEVRFRESPSPRNPLGVKGVGEAGVIPVTAAVISAVEDALAPFGVRIDETPVSPVRLVELILAGARPEPAS